MQHRYVGDIGDYFKLGLIRALCADSDIGIAWWLYPNERHNSDGKHTTYLKRPEKWRLLDAELFDYLGAIDLSKRNITALENEIIFKKALFASDAYPMPENHRERAAARKDWFSKVKQQLRGAEVVFADPDNGIQPDSFSAGNAKAGKSITFQEIRELAEGSRWLIVYHHQTRRKGGHLAEVDYLARKLRDEGFDKVDAIRAHRYSPRVFFILNAPELVRVSARLFSQRWPETFSWHPDEFYPK